MNNIKTKKSDERYYRLSSFYPAAFLFAKGLELVNVDKTDPQRAQFVFVDAPECEGLLDIFNFGKEDAPDAMVDARKLVAAIKRLKDKLYQDKF